MRQTETYKLNLIEKDDTFSPDPLNQNTQKIEQELSAETAQRAEADAALNGRVTALEAHKLVIGQYVGRYASDEGSGEQTIHLGFTPTFLFIQPPNGFCAVATLHGRASALKIIDGGFIVSQSTVNIRNVLYYYYAFV